MNEPWTPGPWTFSKDEFRHRFTVQMGDDLALAATAYTPEEERIWDADFRLISLAPEMAELLAHWAAPGYEHETDGSRDRARDLLARARGEA